MFEIVKAICFFNKKLLSLAQAYFLLLFMALLIFAFLNLLIYVGSAVDYPIA